MAAVAGIVPVVPGAVPVPNPTPAQNPTSWSMIATLPPTQPTMEPADLFPGIDLSSVPKVSTEAYLNRQHLYEFGSQQVIDTHLAEALEDGNVESFLAVLGNAYGG